MTNKISMWGFVAAIAYLVMAVGLYVYAIRCHGMFCDVEVGLAVLPWALFMENAMEWFWIAAVINVLILYFLFAALQKLLQKSKS